MAKSTSKVRRKKPRKPSKDFPLFPHAAGVWAKKVCGKLRYFGPWDDPQAALSRWLEEKDDLLAGRTPRVKQPDELTVKHLADAFLTAKMDRYENGELTAATFREYRTICQHAADVFGKDRAVSDLGVSDFDALRRSFAKRHGANRLGKDIRVIRMLFKFGYDAELLDRQIRFGPNFKEPSKKTKLRERRKKGRKDFNADELRRIISEANQPLRAMIFLGINCGFGQKDCADLPMSAIEGKWIAFPRPKTEEDRRCCLWPETVEALEDAASHRGTPKDPADADCVFITRNGNRFVRMTPNADPAKQCRVDTVSHAFGRLLKSLNINGHRGF
ncbi:MAG: hypothetical protein IID46_08520, partial [Planctomycetes bacterium]|nr:hypothetical protein [Planctomycetota bacterium]